ncbi:Transglutaminase-like_superfamily protein [Hexamita inflata]|uniref:Transglutaminase-like_superfamily protein n=1 Tax=Hexamita inflata TaxID=28002 RepID=A0ABP1JZI3_9EUKA
MNQLLLSNSSIGQHVVRRVSDPGSESEWLHFLFISIFDDLSIYTARDINLIIISGQKNYSSCQYYNITRQNILNTTKLAFAGALTLLYFLQQIKINAEVKKTEYEAENRKFNYYYVIIEYGGEKYALDPGMETYCEGEVLYQWFMLNRTQMKAKKTERHTAEIKELSHKYLDYYNTYMLNVNKSNAQERIVQLANKIYKYKTIKIKMENCNEEMKDAFITDLNIQLVKTAHQKQLKFIHKITKHSQIEDIIQPYYIKEECCITTLENFKAELYEHLTTCNKNQIELQILNYYVHIQKLNRTESCKYLTQIQLIINDIQAELNNIIKFSYSWKGEYIQHELEIKKQISSAPIIQLNTQAHRYYQNQIPNRFVFEQIINAAIRLQQHVCIKSTHQFTVENLHLTQKILQMDYPELWYVKLEQFTPINNIICGLELFLIDQQEIKDKNTLLLKSIQPIKQQIINRGLSQVQTEYLIQSALRRTICYKQSSNQNAYDIIGALVQRQCVCQGFACAFKYLCDIFGLKSIVVFGLGLNEPHAWNIIQIDNIYYHVDPTWNGTTNLWFNVNDQLCYKKHIPDQQFVLPKCSSMASNYYALKGNIIRNSQDLINLIINCKINIQNIVLVECDMQDIINSIQLVQTAVSYIKKTKIVLTDVSIIEEMGLQFTIQEKGLLQTVIQGPGKYLLKANIEQFKALLETLDYQKVKFSEQGDYIVEQLFQQVCGRRLIELRGLFYVINFVETKQCQACQYFHFANNQQNSRKRLQPFNRQITIFVFNIYQNILFVFQITLFIFYKCVCTLLCHFIHQYAFYNTLDTNDILCTNTHICYYIICSRHITHLLLYIHDSVYMLLLLVLQLGLLLVGYNLQFFVVQLQFHILLDLFSFNQLCFQHNPLFQFLYILAAIISSKKTHQLILLTQNKQTSLWSNEYIVLETQYFLQVGLRNQLLYNYYCSNELFQVVLWEYHENLQILTFNRVISQILILYISWLKFSTFCITIKGRLHLQLELIQSFSLVLLLQTQDIKQLNSITTSLNFMIILYQVDLVQKFQHIQALLIQYTQLRQLYHNNYHRIVCSQKNLKLLIQNFELWFLLVYFSSKLLLHDHQIFYLVLLDHLRHIHSQNFQILLHQILYRLNLYRFLLQVNLITIQYDHNRHSNVFPPILCKTFQLHQLQTNCVFQCSQTNYIRQILALYLISSLQIVSLSIYRILIQLIQNALHISTFFLLQSKFQCYCRIMEQIIMYGFHRCFHSLLALFLLGAKWKY